jgi:hypothetical protein
MNKFRKLGFINDNGHLEVQNALLNVVCRTVPISGSRTNESVTVFYVEQPGPLTCPRLHAGLHHSWVG